MTLRPLVVILLLCLFFSGCTRNSNNEHLIEQISESTHAFSSSEEQKANENPSPGPISEMHFCDTFEAADSINLFATALLEFFSDGYKGDNAPTHLGGFSTGAFIVDVDGTGTMGVLAIKISQPIPYDYPWFDNRVFYLYDGNILYYDIPIYRRSRILITEESRRLVHIHEGGTWLAFDFFSLAGGRLVQSSRLEWAVTYPCEQHPYGEDVFSYFNENNWEINWSHPPRFITEEEFNEIIVKYGLDKTFCVWSNRFNDDTSYIFSMIAP